MPKQKRKLDAVELETRRERKKNSMTIFVNGNQVRVPRPQQVESMPVAEFIEVNADPVWLHQNEMWELMSPCVDQKAPKE